MHKPKTLLILTPGFPVNEEDSVCLPVQQALLKTFKEDYPSIRIIILAFQYPYDENPYQWFGVDVFPFNGKNKGGIKRWLVRKKIFSRLNKINQDYDITGMLSFWYGECALVAESFAKQNGLVHKCWLLGQDARKENKFPSRVGLGAAQLLAHSDFLVREFEKNHGVKPAQLLLPGFSASQFPNKLPLKSIDLLGVGSLIALKQFEQFIEIVLALRPSQPGIRAIIIGDGPERNRLSSLIIQNQLEKNIELLGSLPHEKVIDYMSRSKVLLHPSSYEGFSGVCLEALFAGAAVVSYCRAMDYEIANWHIVNGLDEMKQVTGNCWGKQTGLHGFSPRSLPNHPQKL